MALPVIKVESLSKKFVIAHEDVEKHTTLRDAITSGAKKIFKKNKNYHTTEEFWALKDVNFEIQQGDRVGIIGRNGAGKSTLLKVLSRITDPSAGRVRIRGRVASLLEVGTGFHPELTGRENIFLNGAILGMNRVEIRKKFDEIVSFAEIEKFLDTPVKRYSSGMYVRLAFAVAAHLEPEILIIDEVLAVGDAQFQKKCLGKMEDVSKNEGRTVLFVSHNMGVVNQLCRNAILMKQGKMEIFDSVSTVMQAYMSSNQDSNIYMAEEGVALKKNIFFSTIYSTNERGEKVSDYSFSENIYLNFEFVLRQKVSNLQVGIGLNDKLQNRIFTILKPIEFFKKHGSDIYQGQVKLPAGIIAPNIYSFVFALWTKEGHVFDLVENVCLTKVYDNGTELALYEGMDHGSIIVNADWKS